MITFYNAMLWTTGNDVLPYDTGSYIMCATFLFIASIINANIMGNLAVIAQTFSRKLQLV